MWHDVAISLLNKLKISKFENDSVALMCHRDRPLQIHIPQSPSSVAGKRRCLL